MEDFSMVEYKYNIGDKVRFRTNYFMDDTCASLEGKVFTITGQTWSNGPAYRVNLPVYYPLRDYYIFSEDAFVGKVD